MTDTIYIALKDTIFSQQGIIDAYRDLLQSQQGTYDTFIFILLGLFLANIATNYFFTKRRLRSEVEDVFSEKEKTFRKDLESHIDKSIKEHTNETERHFKFVEAELYRLFAISNRQDKFHAQAFDFFVHAVSLYEEALSQELARICAKQSLLELNFFVKDRKKLWEEYFSNIRNRESLIDLLEGFPKYVYEEKKEILKLIPKEDDNNNKTKTEPGGNS